MREQKKVVLVNTKYCVSMCKKKQNQHGYKEYSKVKNRWILLEISAVRCSQILFIKW